MMMRKKILGAAVMVVCAALLSGCWSSLRGDTYSRSEARQPQRVEFARIEHLRPVRIEGTKSGAGSIVGGVAGAIGGSTIGDGRGSAIMAVIGSAVGGLVGGMAEEAITRSDGVEITVRKENGDVLAIVQAVAPNEIFRVGDRVRLMHSYEGVRVSY